VLSCPQTICLLKKLKPINKTSCEKPKGAKQKRAAAGPLRSRYQ
jgi:hypothetical protein